VSDFDDQMLERDLHEALGDDGPAPELRGRILDAVNGRARPARIIPLPKRGTPWAAYVAAAAALVLAAGAAWYAMSRPSAPSTITEPGTNPERAADQPPSQPRPANQQPELPPVVPEPQDPPQKQPQETPTEQPQKQLPETPPERPDPEKPQPDEPPLPAPEPDDVVEQPAPQPDKPDTQAEPKTRVVAGTLLSDGGLKFRTSADSPWRDLDGTEIDAGWQLKAAKATDVQLANGGLLRFEGEVQLEAASVTTLVRAASLYFDTLGITGTFRVTHGELELSFADSECLLDTSSSAIEVFCFEGRVLCAGESVPGGQRGRLTARSLSGLRELRDVERAPKLLTGMTPRVLAKPEASAAKVSGENSFIEFVLKPELINVTGAELRIRFRGRGGALYVQAQREAGVAQWGKWQPLSKQGEWQDWSIPLADLRQDDGRGDQPAAIGEALRVIKVFIQDGQDAELEIESLEIVRVRK
jgi:hypothetical protein